MEEKTTCPCVLKQDDSCFVEKTEVNNQPFESYMCFKCGWTTDSYLQVGADTQLQRESSHSRLINELKIVDYERKLVWYPAVINVGPKGLIFPEGSEDNWKWKYAKLVDIPESERENFPVPNKEGEFYKSRLDIEGATEYGRYDFLEACKEMGIAVDK